MLNEVHAEDGSVYWIVSSFPDEMRDDKLMTVEDKLGEARAPEDLFNMIQKTTPYTGDGFFRPATQADTWYDASHEGVFKIVDIPLMKAMPVSSFYSMVTFAESV